MLKILQVRHEAAFVVRGAVRDATGERGSLRSAGKKIQDIDNVMHPIVRGKMPYVQILQIFGGVCLPIPQVWLPHSSGLASPFLGTATVWKKRRERWIINPALTTRWFTT